MPIFYCHIKKNAQEIVTEEKTLTHHLRDVMRIGKNETIRFFDNNYIYTTKAKEVTKTKIVCHIEKKTRAKQFLPEISIVQSIIKPRLLEEIIKLCVPVGVQTFFFTKTNKSQKYNIEKKIQRFNAIALSVAEQSEVAFVPKVAMLNRVEDFFKLKDGSFSIVLEPSAQQNIISLLKNAMPKKLSIMIGPEGGFSKKEIKMFNVYNIPFVFLNTGIFRSALAGFASALIARELMSNR
ncbi:MAG: RsmE family RNA methyltransferase [Caldisericota bacterium]|nr:RsmE family RNA methyltransferase [Caldisericota bacterium]